jgi:uncharacterized LabA/DUF88 family protein
LTKKGIHALQQFDLKLQKDITLLQRERSTSDRTLTLLLSGKHERDELRSQSLEPTTHLLIDGNAMYFIRKEIGKINYQVLRDTLTMGDERVNCKFYVADTRDPGEQAFLTAIKYLGFEVILFPMTDCIDGSQKVKGDDVKIAIDAVTVRPGDRVIICASDADFVPVVDWLKQMSIDCKIVAYQPYLANRLRQAAGENLIYLTDIPGINLN